MKIVTLGSTLFLSWTITIVLCNKYTKDGQECTKDKHGNEHCYKKDEFDEEDDEPMFYEEDPIGKDPLFIWDPVRVWYYFISTTRTHTHAHTCIRT